MAKLKNGASWRYQPVYIDEPIGRLVTLIEAHFDENGIFSMWTEGDACPAGEDAQELAADLNRMMVDALSWEPAPRSDLKPGYVFERRISMEERLKLVDYVMEVKDAMNNRAIPKQQRPN